MGIRVDFLVKHVRPTDDGAPLVCTPELRQALHDLGVADADVTTAFTYWAAVADVPVTPEYQDVFVSAATVVSAARWDELYPTSRSSVAFLNGPLLKELSDVSGQHPGRTFDAELAEHVPVVVTLRRGHPEQTQVAYGVRGLRVAADDDGMCCHLESVLT
ncbi:hypothetical protein [Thalassiella azotivora]